MRNTLSRLATLATIATTACASDIVVTTPTSAADAQSSADSGNLNNISKDIGGDVSSVLSDDVKAGQDSKDSADVKKCGAVSFEYDFPSTCLNVDFDDKGNSIGAMKIQTVVKAKTGEIVSPMRMYISDGKGVDANTIGYGVETVACADDVTKVDVNMPVINQEGVQGGQKWRSFPQIQEGELFTIGVESGKDCGFQETHFMYAIPKGGGDPDVNNDRDGSLEKPFYFGVCDGKGMEVPEGGTCK